MTAARRVMERSTLARSLAWAVLAALAIILVSDLVSAYNDLQLATGAYYFAALAGLTVLAGQSGQISLGQGALMAVGAYTVALLIGNEGWALLPAIVAAVAVSVLVGIPVGAAASRLRGPYLAGATLALAVGLPALADKFPTLLGGENGLTINPPVPPSWLGADFPLERWEAWIAGAGAVVVLFVLYNLIGSGAGRSIAGRPRRRDRRLAVRAVGGAQPGDRVHHLGRVRGPGGCAAGGRPAIGPAGCVPAAALALAADRRRPRRPGVTGGSDVGRGAAHPAAQLDHQPGALVLAVDAGLGQPAAGHLRGRAHRGHDRVAERDPGRTAGDLRPPAQPPGAQPDGGVRVDRRRRFGGADPAWGTPSSAACTSRSRS